MAKTYQERGKPVYTFRKNDHEQVQASLSTYNGKEYIDLRVFYVVDGGEFRPSPKGLTISREMLPELQKAVAALIEACEKAVG